VSGVLVVGSSNTDLVCVTERLPHPGETVRGSRFATYAGGKGANQAVAAARAGARVTFVGAVGDDQYGRDRLTDLHREGIDVSLTPMLLGVTSGVAVITVDSRGENQIIMVPGANDAVTPAAATRAVKQAEAAILSLTLEIPSETVRTALEARPANMQAVLNAAVFDPRVRELAHLIDVLIVNEVEAGEWLGRPVTAASAAEDARELWSSGPHLAIITLGSYGAVYTVDGLPLHQPALAVDVVDTTGAGDAFCGVLAAWLARGAQPRDAVLAGVAAGTLAVGVSGAQPSLPSLAHIEHMLTRLPSVQSLS
jgi:ribokinase